MCSGRGSHQQSFERRTTASAVQSHPAALLREGKVPEVSVRFETGQLEVDPVEPATLDLLHEGSDPGLEEGRGVGSGIRRRWQGRCHFGGERQA